MTAFLLHKPWYASSKLNTVEDAEGDTEDEDVAIVEYTNRALPPSPCPDGIHHDRLTKTSSSSVIRDHSLSDRTPISSSDPEPQLQIRNSNFRHRYRRRLRTGISMLSSDSVQIIPRLWFTSLLKSMGMRPGKTIEASAKLEGQNAKSAVGSLDMKLGPESNNEAQWQGILAETNNGKRYWLRPKGESRQALL